jgi:hypothetical protein
MTLKERIEKNKYRNEIILSENLQNEASFYISTDQTNPHWNLFKQRVLNIYVGDTNKYNRFFSAFSSSTMRSVELCDNVYAQLYRVFDSQDRVIEYNFNNDDLHADATTYLDRFNEFWYKEWWEAYKHQFCSFIVVDLPTYQTTKFPEPYIFILDISRVHYIVPTDEWGVKEIIFQAVEDEKLYYYYYTDTFYSKYEIKDDQEIEQFKFDHKLGHCPVHSAWNEKLNNKNWLLKRSAITPNFEDLFWINIKTVESRKADLLYLNPLLQMPKLSCGYDSSKKSMSGHHYPDSKCVGGYLYSSTDKTPIFDQYDNVVLCPSCGKQRHSGGGAGNMIQIDLDSQAIKDGKVDPSNTLAKYITPDIQGIKEQYSRIKDEEDRFIKNAVGSDDQPTKSALNELQQTAIFESRENVLVRISEQISKIRTLVTKDQLTLRYAESFVYNQFSQGTKFYLVEVSDLLEMREKAKDPIQKREIDEQIVEVKFKNNQKKKDEGKLLYKLLPYNTLTDTEFTDLMETGKINDSQTIALRLQFSNAVEMFESEYGSIIEFYTLKFPEGTTEIERVKIIEGYLKGYLNIEKDVQNTILRKVG